MQGLDARSAIVRSLKTKLTHIGSTAREVSDALDLLRAGVLRSVKELESQLAVVEADPAPASLPDLGCGMTEGRGGFPEATFEVSRFAEGAIDADGTVYDVLEAADALPGWTSSAR